MCLINNDFIPKVHSLAIPIFPVHFNHLANIKIPWSSNNMRRFTFSTAVKKKRHKTITYGFQVPRVPRRTRAWMQEVWGLHTWGKIIHCHCFYLLVVKGAGGGSVMRLLTNGTLPYNEMDGGFLPGKISPHLAHCVRGGYVCLWPRAVVKVVLKLKLQQNSKWN